MTTTLIAALVVGLIAPVARALAWGVPFSLLSIGTVGASFVGSFITVLIVGAALSVLLPVTQLAPERVDLIAGVSAGAAGLLFLLSSARRMRSLRGLSVLCQRLAEEDARPGASRALRRLLDRVESQDRQRYADLVLMATGPLTQASLWEQARTRLSSLVGKPLAQEQSILRDQALATCELQFDDTDAARTAIERIPRPADHSIEVWLVAMEALVLAVRGDAEGATAKLQGQGTEDNPSLEASHRLVKAHILAGKGELGAAREELQAVRNAAGRGGLSRALHPQGPASEIARELLESDSDTSPV